ncbi:hypothetical protein FHS96_004453 [Sphingomonas zeicaulis]|uniref:hypothetical protein n=1 Tax=Sphingomonas zeicaulis TaxID=1632740 RepID=UPI003D20A9BA
MDEFGKPWFAPKRFGYGAGLPIATAGWVFIAAHLLLIGLGIFFLVGVTRAAWLATIIVVALPIYAAKTRGGWRWRWGGEDRG